MIFLTIAPLGFLPFGEDKVISVRLRYFRGQSLYNTSEHYLYVIGLFAKK